MLKAEIVDGKVYDLASVREKPKKVGEHSAKKIVDGKPVAYTLPRIVLSSAYSELIGREFIPFKAKVKVEEFGEGEAVILFFPKT
jgi:hypothetical protein